MKKKPRPTTGETVMVKVHLPESLHRQVKAAAAIDGIRVGDEIVALVAKALKRRK